MTKFLLLISITVLLICVRTQDPPADVPPTWQEHWLEHNQLLTLQSWDDNVAVYYDPDMDTSITWPKDKMTQVWAYTKQVYGDFGGDKQRLFVVLHQNKYSGGHPSTYFDESHDNRNVIDVGQGEGASWQDDSGWNLASLTHEVSHIVESASKDVHNSPAFSIWHDSKWAEIFVYDVYNKLGWTDDANQWMDDRNNADPDNFPRDGTKWFTNWFYPIYKDHGETDALNRYFDLLSQNFPKTAIDDTHFQYDRDLNFGEFILFWSGAAQTDLHDLAMDAFGDKDEQGNDWNAQYEQAKKDFPNVMSSGQSGLAADAGQQQLDPLQINLNITDNPDGAPDYPQQAKDLISKWDPFITNLLATDGFTPLRNVTFTFQKGLSAPALTSGDTTSVNVDYINSNPDDLGMMIHEYTHIVQQYPANQFGEDAGWLTEGIADYVRYIYYEPNHDNPNDPPATDSWFQTNQPQPTDNYKSGYGNAARFIYWIGQKFSISDLLQQLNSQMRAGTYQPQIFQDLTGQSVDDLWNSYANEVGAPDLAVQTSAGKKATKSRTCRRFRR